MEYIIWDSLICQQNHRLYNGSLDHGSREDPGAMCSIIGKTLWHLSMNKGINRSNGAEGQYATYVWSDDIVLRQK